MKEASNLRGTGLCEAHNWRGVTRHTGTSHARRCSQQEWLREFDLIRLAGTDTSCEVHTLIQPILRALKPSCQSSSTSELYHQTAVKSWKKKTVHLSQLPNEFLSFALTRRITSVCTIAACLSLLGEIRSNSFWPLLLTAPPSMRRPGVPRHASSVVSLVDVSREGGQAIPTLILRTY